MNDWISPLSRNTDPATSHIAEEKHTRLGKRAIRARQVLKLIHDHPGATAGELSRYMLEEYPLLSISVCAETPHKRAPELWDKGLVYNGRDRKCLDSGYLRATWRITRAGRAELDDKGAGV